MNHQFAIVSPAVAGEVQRLSCCGQFVAERLSYLYALHVGGNGDEVSAGVPAVGDHGSIDVESGTLSANRFAPLSAALGRTELQNAGLAVYVEISWIM